MKATVAVVQGVEPVVERGRLVVRLALCPGKQPAAYLPDRELSALLPRSLLVGSLRAAPRELLGTIGPILDRLVKGRSVRLWDYRDRSYASFLSWRSVRFAEPSDDSASTPGRTGPPGGRTAAAPRGGTS